MMRKNFVKRTSALALAAFMAASAAGCSSGGGSRTAAAPDTTAQEAASGEEAKADGDKGETESSGEPVTIRLVHYMGEQAKRDALDAMLAAFNEAHPEIHVDVEVVASSSYIATYKNYIAAGEALDIMFGKPQTMQEFVDGGYFMDLKDEACMTNVLPMLVTLVGACAFRLVWLATVFHIPAFHRIETVYIVYPISWTLTALAHGICFFFAYRKLMRRVGAQGEVPQQAA